MANLINRKACKDHALKFAKDNRTGWHAERVSKEFLDAIDRKVKHVIEHAIFHHRTCGKTIKDII